MLLHFKHVWRIASLVVLTLLSIELHATHNRAGEITYTHRPDMGPFMYEIKIQTCTKSSSLADRPWLKIRYGDEGPNVTESDLDSLPRVQIIDQPGIDAQLNIYTGFHNYGGPGVFNLVVIDPNRNSDINNIRNSVSVVFCIQTELVIGIATGHNNSVQLLNPPKERACIFQPWIHNPGAYDPDGDSLVYSLVPCLEDENTPISSWEMPDVSTPGTDDVFSINSQTGDVTWLVPNLAGEFNIAILIKEYRNGIYVGSVLRDMQIDVINCGNQAPILADLPDYCIEAGQTLIVHVTASDPDGDALTYSAYGGPLSSVENEASFNTASRTFSWTPQCEEVRNQTYAVSFEVTDDGNIPLTDIETINIRVVAPRVENPEALATGNSIALNWDETPCAPVFTESEAAQVVYKVYRRADLFGFVPDSCEVGVPEYTGYEEIGQTQGLGNTSYTDTDVFYGGIYCYMIATCWPDGAISYASAEFCDTIKKDIPVITKVSIETTDIATGSDTIWWSSPNDLDTLIFTGPYQYKLLYVQGNGTPSEIVYETDVSPYLLIQEYEFIHQNINTQDNAHRYSVQIFSNGELVNTSSAASSPFLLTTPQDNAVAITIEENIPWVNTRYFVYRKDPGELDYALVGETETRNYLDTGLVNNQVYCYKVLCQGTYNASFVPDPLFNWSQEVCARPYDQTPPCAPELTVNADCETQLATLVWNNPNNTCADDVTAYNIYYAPTSADTLKLLAQISNLTDTIFLFNEDGLFNSIAGCFAVTALDSLNLWPDGSLNQNESALSNVVCTDNCPLYFLPNIFTPNGDGNNDFFLPIADRFVKDVKFQVFNRWGTLVFETNDHKIMWNGTNKDTGELTADGVYYYAIEVNTIRLEGIVTEKFKGYIQVVGATKATPTE